MSSPSVATQAFEVLDPVLVPAGFAPGQGQGQLLWCADHEDFVARHPTVPGVGDDDQGPGGCVDLVVEVIGDAVDDVRLEGPSLAQTLRSMGRDEDAAQVEHARQLPFDAALGVLADVLGRLLGTAAPGAGPDPAESCGP